MTVNNTQPTYEELVQLVESLERENAQLKNIQTSANFSVPLTDFQRAVILNQNADYDTEVTKLQVRLPSDVHNKMNVFSDLWKMSLNDLVLLCLNATMVGFANADDAQRQLKIQELGSLYNNYVVPLKKTKSTAKSAN